MKTALIGLGPQGRRILSALAVIEGIDLVAVVDRRSDALGAAEIPASTLRLGHPDQLWHSGALDLVCVATNGPSHAEMAVQAMEAGVGRLMIEKPMACSLAECDRMLQVAVRLGARLAVNQSRRHAPAYAWLRDRIRSGHWGQVRCVWIQRPGVGLGGLAVHSFDLVRFLTDREVTSVTAWVDPPRGRNPRGDEFVDPGGLVVLEITGGARAIVAQIEDGAGPMSVEIDLTAARVRVDERSGQIEVLERDLSVKPAPNRPASFAPAALPPHLSARTDLGVMLQGLIRELMGVGVMECDAHHGRAAVEVLAAAHLSHRRGHVPVRLPLVDAESAALWLPVT